MTHEDDIAAKYHAGLAGKADAEAHFDMRYRTTGLTKYLLALRATQAGAQNQTLRDMANDPTGNVYDHYAALVALALGN